MSYLEVLKGWLPAYLFYLPLILPLLAGVVLSARMVIRSGHRPERLLLTGLSLLLVAIVAQPWLRAIEVWSVLQHFGRGNPYIQDNIMVLIVNIIIAAGILCVILAYWWRWQADRQSAEEYGTKAVTR